MIFTHLSPEFIRRKYTTSKWKVLLLSTGDRVAPTVVRSTDAVKLLEALLQACQNTSEVPAAG